MIYAVDNHRYLTRVPHEATYLRWKSRMTAEELQAVKDELNRRIDGGDIHVSSWIPGSDWTDTVFDPIYSKACHCDEDAAGMFFGLILWDVLMERDDVWGFGRYSKGGIPITGLTYFKLENPPPLDERVLA